MRKKSEFLKSWGKAFEIFKSLVDAVLAAGGGDEDIANIQTNKGLLTELVAVVMKYADQETGVKKWSVWKTIKLGTHKTAGEFRAALIAADCQISNWADQLLAKTPLASEETVDLVLLTTAELTGNPNGGTTANVFAGAARLGFKKCPAEVGPALREQYLNQPLGEWIYIGMKPIADSDGDPSVFSVNHDEDGRWLDAFYANPTDVWNPEDRWVFVRGKQST